MRSTFAADVHRFESSSEMPNSCLSSVAICSKPTSFAVPVVISMTPLCLLSNLAAVGALSRRTWSGSLSWMVFRSSVRSMGTIMGRSPSTGSRPTGADSWVGKAGAFAPMILGPAALRVRMASLAIRCATVNKFKGSLLEGPSVWGKALNRISSIATLSARRSASSRAASSAASFLFFTCLAW